MRASHTFFQRHEVLRLGTGLTGAFLGALAVVDAWGVPADPANAEVLHVKPVTQWHLVWYEGSHGPAHVSSTDSHDDRYYGKINTFESLGLDLVEGLTGAALMYAARFKESKPPETIQERDTDTDR